MTNDFEHLLREALEPLLVGEGDPDKVRAFVHRAGQGSLPAAALERIAQDILAKAGRPAGQAAPAEAPLPQTPELLIDWGFHPEAGSDLTPEFHLLCPGRSGQPHVSVQLDERLDRRHWNPCPKLELEEPSHWVFYQKLRLPIDEKFVGQRQYLLEVRVVFPAEAGRASECFSGKLRIGLSDAAQKVQRTLEIGGEGSALVNLQGLDLRDFARIRVQATDQAVVNLQEVLHALAQQRAEPKPAERPVIVRLPLRSDWELERCMPRRSPRGQRCPMDTAALVLPGGRRVLLLAQSRVVFGRQRVDDRGQRASDVVLRLWPLGQEQKLLSGLISRRHFSLELRPEGLLVSDLGSKLGTYLDDQPLAAPLLLQRADTQPRRVLDVAGILGLEFSLHRDGGWTPWAECADLADGQYGRAVQATPPPAWQAAWTARIDALRIRRLRNLPLRRYLNALRKKYANVAAEYQKLGEIADAADLVDDLAGKEEYVLVFRSATVGSAETDAISLRAADVAESHARILHLGGAFWLEPLCGDAATHVDGQPLGAHELLPLAPGMELQFGEARVHFERFGQIEL